MPEAQSISTVDSTVTLLFLKPTATECGVLNTKIHCIKIYLNNENYYIEIKND